jgi:hypothetical protein
MTTSTLSDLAKYYQDLDSDQITLVRRQIVYSEIVISKDEYEKIKNDDDYESLDELRSKMVTDDCMKYVGDEQESWMLFHGDVTDASDDLIFWTDKEWDDFWFLK